MTMKKYIIKNKESNHYYSNKHLDFVAFVEKNAYKFSLDELIDLDLKNHYSYKNIEIIELERER